MLWFPICAYSLSLVTPNIIVYRIAVIDHFQQPYLCKEEAYEGYDLPSLCLRYCHIQILKICSLLQIVPVSSIESCALLPIYSSKSLEWLSCLISHGPGAGPCTEYVISFLSRASEIQSPTDNTCFAYSTFAGAAITWPHGDAQAEVCNLGASGDAQLALVLENCFLFICCKYSLTPLQNQFTSCFISCLSARWRCTEELTREKGKPVNATGYHKSHSNYLRDVADHTGHVLWISPSLTRANAACYGCASWHTVVFSVTLSLGQKTAPDLKWC